VFLEESANFAVVIKFTALIQVDVLARNVGSMLLQPVVKPVQGSSFRDTWGAIKSAGCMVGYQDLAHFTIEAAICFTAGFVFVASASEGKVNG
jgi:hypothetical protein